MTRQTRSQEGVITDVELIGNVKVPSLRGKSYMPEMGGRLGPPPRPSFALTARRNGLRAVLVGLLRKGDRNA